MQASGYGNPLEYGATYTTAYEVQFTTRTPTGYRDVQQPERSILYPNTGKRSINAQRQCIERNGIEAKFVKNRVGFNVTYFTAINGPRIVTEQWSQASGFTVV